MPMHRSRLPPIAVSRLPNTCSTRARTLARRLFSRFLYDVSGWSLGRLNVTRDWMRCARSARSTSSAR